MSDYLDQIRDLSPFERLVHWVTEREQIRVKRLRGEPAPWTDDPILRSYRFCNAVRMDDKVSQWVLVNWYRPYYGHPSMLLACALARFINLPESLEEIGIKTVLRWDRGRIKRVLRSRRDRGETVFNAAYMVRGNDGEDKIDSVVDYYVQSLRSNGVKIDPSSMENTWAQIEKCYGWGSFMAGQVVADLRWAVPGKWADKDTWAPIGPGSKRGMNRLHNRQPDAKLSASDFLTWLRELMAKLTPRLPPSLKGRLEAHDAQNVLCEWDKAERALWGQGVPKQRYRYEEA